KKIAYIQGATTDENVLVVPGPKTECVTSERSRIYFIHSPVISRTSHYRALINLRAIEQILERERPDLIESGDPYQVAWKAIASGEALRIPVVGFYHSHFPEAYVRSAAKFLGQTAGEAMMDFTRRYVCNLYNSFQVTLVPSARLGAVLTEWGVENVRAVNLGVCTSVFWACRVGKSGLRDAGGRHSRQLHGQDYSARPGVVGGGRDARISGPHHRNRLLAQPATTGGARLAAG